MFELRISFKPTEKDDLDSSQVLETFKALGLEDVVESLEWIGEEGDHPVLSGDQVQCSHWSFFRETQHELRSIVDRLRTTNLAEHMDCELRDIGEAGWESVWQGEEQSQSIGRFWIKIQHAEDERAMQASAQQDLILIRAGRSSFGSGQHATTRACLRALTKLSKVRHFESCLDVGTGNGILAIAAARIGVKEIIATDIDAEVIGDAELNARLNGVRVDFRQSAEVPQGAFDLIFCNILLPELLRILPELATRGRIGASVLLAGFHLIDSDRVIEWAESFGLCFSSREVDTDWPCLCFKVLPQDRR